MPIGCFLAGKDDGYQTGVEEELGTPPNMLPLMEQGPHHEYENPLYPKAEFKKEYALKKGMHRVFLDIMGKGSTKDMDFLVLEDRRQPPKLDQPRFQQGEKGRASVDGGGSQVKEQTVQLDGG